MKKIEKIEEIQKIAYDIFLKFVNFCERNNLRYCLSGGTLLGAIRHNGFIPWDDDIDIIMPRPDYMKFLKLLQEKEKNWEKENDLKVNSIYLNNQSIFPLMRICDERTKVYFKNNNINENSGMWIDIFPCDGVPNNPILQKLFFFYYRILADCQVASITKLGIKRRSEFLTKLQWILFPIYFIFKKIGPLFFCKKIEKHSLRYDFNMTENVAVICGRAGIKEIMPKKDFFKLKKHIFVDREFYIPGNYDYYLSRLYGDYMKLPPKEERVARHEIEIYWK